MPAPCTVGENDGGLGSAMERLLVLDLGDRSTALGRTYFDLRFSCTQGKAASGKHGDGVGISFGTHTIIINSNVTN